MTESLTALSSPQADGQLVGSGYAITSEVTANAFVNDPLLVASWNRLPKDGHLLDGGAYRSRRHSCFVWSAQELRQVSHRAHWQPIDYNALHGGIERMFEPMEAEVVSSPLWQQLLSGLAARFARLAAVDEWSIEAHQFRIDTASGVGRPTPEGAHRDGVDYVAIILIGRMGIKGGETRVFEAVGNAGVRFTLLQPGSMLLLDDARVIHETTPIQPLVTGAVGHRDTLVLTFRRDGFQAPLVKFANSV